MNEITQIELEKNQTEALKKKSLFYSLKEAITTNFSLGLADNYFGAYAIALRADVTVIGLLTSLPNLIGPLAQIWTSNLMKFFSRKKIFITAVLIQILFWLPIIFVSYLYLHDDQSIYLLLIAFFLAYAFLGNLAQPAWVSWMGDLVEPKQLGRFFGFRNSLASLAALVGIVLGGFVLDLFKFNLGRQEIFIGFGLIFFVGMLVRFISLYFISRQFEPKFIFERSDYFSFWSFLKKSSSNNFGRFSIYVALILLTANVAGPYYVIYILRDLKFSYLEFMLINLVGLLATFLTMPFWGRLGDHFGNVGILKLTGLLTSLPALLWFFTIFLSKIVSFYFILTISFFGGFLWAGFNLAAGNFLYDSVTPKRRSLCSAYSSIFNGLGIVVGTLIGSFTINYFPFRFFNLIMVVSFISGVLRLFVGLFMFPLVQEVRPIEKGIVFNFNSFATQIFRQPYDLIFAHSAKKIKNTLKRKNGNNDVG
ncbi:MAG: MFS transporter [Patescibacteria group bacterium]|nr:MFS transporter [Patescibacteria group bacterium]MCL5257819.1 MFS transporter [Patescibacteria group bacterium]